VGGGAVGRHRARARLPIPVHASRRAGAAEARDAARANVGGAGAGLRARRPTDRRGGAGEPRPARPERQPARRRGRLPVPLRQLLAARRDGGGAGAGGRGGREGRLRGMTAVEETYLDETAEAYRDEVVAAIAARVEAPASFVLGSGLVGGYRPGESDLDLVVVADAPLEGEARRMAIEQ